MADPAQYMELLRAFECGLQIEHSLRRLCHDLDVFQDEITLERHFTSKALVTFADCADRLVEKFESTTSFQMTVIGRRRECRFSEFSREVTDLIRDHHGGIICALDPVASQFRTGQQNLTARSKWLNDGRPSEQYRDMLHNAGSLARKARGSLLQSLTGLREGVLADARSELTSLADQIGFKHTDQFHISSHARYTPDGEESTDG